MSNLELKENNRSKKYSLHGVVTHHGGSVKSGHYTAFCRNVDTNLWYSYSDKTVKRVDSREVRKSEAFILFYQQ